MTGRRTLALIGSIWNLTKIVVVAVVLVWLTWTWNYPGWAAPGLIVANAMVGMLAILRVAFFWGHLRRPALLWPVLAVLGATAITTAASVAPNLSLFRGWSVTVYIALYFLAADALSRRQIERGLLLGGWCVLGVAVLEAAYLVLYGDATRARIWGNPNTGAMLVAGLAPVGVVVLKRPARWLWLGLAVVAVVATGSRAGLLAMAAGLAVVKGLPWWSVAGLVALGLPFAVLRPVSLSHRLELWQRAVAAWLSRPLTGTGPGTAVLWAWSVADNGFWHAHSTLLTTLSETGIVGTVTGVWLAIRSFALRSRGWPWAVLVSLAVFGVFDDPLLFGGSAWLAILAAIALGETCGVAVAERV